MHFSSNPSTKFEGGLDLKHEKSPKRVLGFIYHIRIHGILLFYRTPTFKGHFVLKDRVSSVCPSPGFLTSLGFRV